MPYFNSVPHLQRINLLQHTCFLANSMPMWILFFTVSSFHQLEHHLFEFFQLFEFQIILSCAPCHLLSAFSSVWIFEVVANFLVWCCCLPDVDRRRRFYFIIYKYLIIFESNVNNFRVLNLNFQIHFECWHRYVIGSRKVRISIWYLMMYAIPDFFQITAMPSRNYFTASRSVAKISHIGNPFLPICSPNAHVRCQEASWFMNGGRRELWGDF